MNHFLPFCIFHLDIYYPSIYNFWSQNFLSLDLIRSFMILGSLKHVTILFCHICQVIDFIVREVCSIFTLVIFSLLLFCIYVVCFVEYCFSSNVLTSNKNQWKRQIVNQIINIRTNEPSDQWTFRLLNHRLIHTSHWMNYKITKCWWKIHQYYDFLITKFMKISESYNDLKLTMIN